MNTILLYDLDAGGVHKFYFAMNIALKRLNFITSMNAGGLDSYILLESLI